MVTAPITAVIILITNSMDIANFMVVDTSKSYLAGLASFVRSNMFIFLFASILGEYIDKSGAAKSIANAIMKKVGNNNPYMVLLGVALVGAILTYGGVSLFVAMFALIPLARAMFKDCNIPWHLFVASWALGATSFTMAMIPGVPSVANINAANAAGVTLTAAPLLGIIATVITITLGCLYIRWALKRAQAKGETYTDEVVKVDVDEKLPNFWISILPLALMIIVIIVGSAFKVSQIVYIGMIGAVVLCIILFHKFIGGKHNEVLSGGVKNSLGPALFTSSAVGVGAVAAAAGGFQVLQEAIFNMPGGTYVSAAVLAGLLGGIMGSGSGAVGIIGQNFIGQYLATGVNPEFLSKIIAMSATTGGALPNSGSMFGMLAAMGLNHKLAYKHFFWISIVVQLIALIVVIIMATLMT
jgi:H+/gluconate symporter-like permease